MQDYLTENTNLHRELCLAYQSYLWLVILQNDGANKNVILYGGKDMSYNTWHTYGYGICVDDIETTAGKLLKLASMKEDVLKEVRE